ncbi:MAG: SRPBCC family protein [Cyclobacteriaceae bacterium]
MKKLDIKLSKEINASSDKVWEILGPNFLSISEWGTGILSSVNNADAELRFDDAPAGGRVCDIKGFGKFDERILHYSHDDKEITWSADSPKIPGFVNGLQNAFRIEELGENKSRISSNLTANMRGVGGFLFGGKIKSNFEKTIEIFLTDIKIYAETGKVSPRKERELNKAS